MADPPEEVRTERLLLRRVTPADLDLVVALHGDPEATRYRPAGPRTPEQSKEMLDGWLAHWAEHGFGYWAMVLPGTGRTIGFGGVGHKELHGEPHLNIHFRLTPSAWGHGYAPEMVAAALALGQRVRPDLTILIITNVHNGPAVRVAQKTGFVEFRQGDFAGGWFRFFRHIGAGT